MTATHALRTPSTTPETTLVITVLDAATIYEGPETIYRYDLPGTGIVEGWALDAVLDQAEKVCGADWPEVSAEVVADPSGTDITDEAVSILRRQLTGAGATVVEPEPALSGREPRARDAPTARHRAAFPRSWEASTLSISPSWSWCSSWPGCPGGPWDAKTQP